MGNPIRKDILFSDIKSDFSLHPVTGDLALATNESAISQAIKNIILTDFGERPFNDQYVASGLRSLLFDLMSPEVTSDIKYAIVEALENYEPRIEIQFVGVVPDYTSQEYKVNIQYKIKANMTPYELKLSISRLA